MNDQKKTDMIPVRMLCEYVYCPRLCYLEWVKSEFVDNAETVEGRYKHRRVDKKRDLLPKEIDEESQFEVSSINISDKSLGLTGKIDLVEVSNGQVTPIDYKKSSVPNVTKNAYESDRVQICAMGLLLRKNGYDVDKGIIYYVKSKTRVEVEFDGDLVQKTKEYVDEIFKMGENQKIPEPLKNSPKCPKCSLVGICMPDEINMINDETKHVRKLLPKRDDESAIYVTGWGKSLHKKGERISIKEKDETIKEVPVRDVSQISIYGNARVTLPLLKYLMQNNIPVFYFSNTGWFYGYSSGHPHKNVELRIKQYKFANDEKESLKLSKKFVEGKIRNCRTLLMRNSKTDISETLKHLERLLDEVDKSTSFDELLGIEGSAAKLYFSNFDEMLKGDNDVKFDSRNKRPPEDPVNAVLSYLYGMLTKECFSALLKIGFDSYLGFFHQPRYGRPSLALDLMEEFRPIIADSVTITLFNNKELTKNDFVISGTDVGLKKKSKKTILKGYERRINSEIKHPMFKYKINYRRIIEVQARLISSYLEGEIDEYVPFCTR